MYTECKYNICIWFYIYISIYKYICFILNRETCIQRNLKTSENDSEYWISFNVTHHSYKLWGYKSQEWTLPRRPIAFMQAGRKKRSFLLGWRLAQHVQQPRSNNWQSTRVWRMDSNVSEDMSTGKMLNVEGHRINHNKTSLSNVVSTFHKQDGDSLCTSLCIEWYRCCLHIGIPWWSPEWVVDTPANHQNLM